MTRPHTPALGLLLGLLSTVAVAHESQATGESSGTDVVVPAQVIADPRRLSHLVAPEDGALVAPIGGFAVAGDYVHAGQLLAVLEPSYAQTARRDLGVELANQQRDEYLSKLQMDRYKVDGSRPFDIKLATPTVQLVADYRSAHAQAAQLQRALQGGVPIIAAQDGILVSAPARAARTTLVGQTLFSLRSPGALAVTVEGVDDLQAETPIAAQTLSGRDLHVHWVSTTFDPALRTKRALYTLDADPAAAIGLPIQLTLHRQAPVTVAEARP